MGKYWVRIPFAGILDVEVEAETADQAKHLAFEQCTVQITPENESCTCSEFEVFEHLVQGNMCAAPLWEVEVQQE